MRSAAWSGRHGGLRGRSPLRRMRPSVVVAGVLLSGALAWAQPASATSITNLEAKATTRAASATEAVSEVSFKATQAIGSGGSVHITAPAGTKFIGGCYYYYGCATVADGIEPAQNANSSVSS